MFGVEHLAWRQFLTSNFLHAQSGGQANFNGTLLFPTQLLLQQLINAIIFITNFFCQIEYKIFLLILLEFHKCIIKSDS